MKQIAKHFIAGVTFLSLFLSAGPALASSIKYDSGYVYQSSDDPYKIDQPIGNVGEDLTIYGKIGTTGQGTVKIYSFTPNSDMERDFSLLFTTKPGVEVDNSSVDLLFVDPTKNTVATDLYASLPLPSDEYHVTGIKKSDTGSVYNDPFLGREYKVASEERMKLSKDQKYYLIFIDYKGEIDNYVIKIGDGHTWTGKALLTNAGDWWKIKFDTYSGNNPFLVHFSNFQLLMLLVGFSVLLGMFIIAGIFALLSGRYKSAGYLLIKLQKFFKFSVWISLWLIALGGYLYFGATQWVGISFAMLVIYIPMLLLFLYQTIRVSPSLAKIELNNREAAIPLALSKRLFFSNFVLTILMIVFTLLLTLALR